MTKSSYSKLLLDPRWQRKRLEVLGRDNFTCQKCGDEESTLQVHHKIYENGLKPWEYCPTTLVTLCYRCHEDEGDKLYNSLGYLSYRARYTLISDEIELLGETLKWLEGHPQKTRVIRLFGQLAKYPEVENLFLDFIKTYKEKNATKGSQSL